MVVEKCRGMNATMLEAEHCGGAASHAGKMKFGVFMTEENVMSWNCRGAGSSEFLHEMKKILKEYRPSVIVLLEPRIRSERADKFATAWGRIVGCARSIRI